MTAKHGAAGTTGNGGFVLVNALVLVLALSAVAVTVLKTSNTAVLNATSLRDAAQADLIADAGLLLVARLLQEDASNGPADHLSDGWRLEDYRTDVLDGTLRIWVRDLQAAYNLNLMISDQPDLAMSAFARLADRNGVTAAATEAIQQHALRWQPPPGTNVEGRGGGARYLPGDIVQLAEVAALPGVSPRAIRRLGTFATTLPRERRINVNTAPFTILADLAPQVEPAAFRRLIASRQSQPFVSMTDFQLRASTLLGNIAARTLPIDLFTVSTNWFEVTSEAEFGGALRRVTSLLYRHPDTGVVTRVLQHPAAAS